VRGVEEQDRAAQRISNQLNRDARLEARGQTQPAAGGAAAAGAATISEQTTPGATLHEAQPVRQSATPLNSATPALRGPDLGIWLSSQPGADGLAIADVSPDSPFARAGLREGDRIISVNRQPVTSDAQFVQMMLSPEFTGPASIVVARGGARETITINPGLVSQSMVAYDPLYLYGLMLDERSPDRLIVQRVFPRTPAFYAGLRPGDVITTVNGQRISDLNALTQALQGAAGDLTLQITRGGQPRQLALEASGAAALRTAMAPGRAAIGAGGVVAGGATTTTQIDQSGLNTTGTIAPGASTTIGTTIPGSTVGAGTGAATLPGAQSGVVPGAGVTPRSRFSPALPSGALPPATTNPTAPNVGPAVPSGALPPATGPGVAPVPGAGVAPSGVGSGAGTTAGGTAGVGTGVGGAGGLGAAVGTGTGANSVGGTGALGGTGSTAGATGVGAGAVGAGAGSGAAPSATGGGTGGAGAGGTGAGGTGGAGAGGT
jgi:membrane-associated protease RseP (regulator of RpoE activity)